MRGLLTISVRAAGALLLFGAVAGASTAASAQASYSPYAETAAGALARYVRTLASDPNNFSALIGAGRAALALGDSQAAAGFFARADEVNPRSPLPQAGMGAVSVVNGEPQAALPYFKRAQQLGAPVASFGADRGLAYDLMGQQAQAQADYRAALGGPDGDEARRRLALSLAISGDKAGALQIIAPLLSRGDAACGRVRAFILALTGDPNGAMTAIDSAMPGSWSRVSPFLQRLPRLQAGQKAAAVNLGIFPDSNSTAFAYASPQPNRSGSTSSALATNVRTDRLSGLDELLRAAPPSSNVQTFTAQPHAGQQRKSVTQLAYSAPARSLRALGQAAAPVRAGKIWLQLASGSDEEALPGQFQRIKSRHRDIFEGIKGYVAKGSDRARLVIGPFRSASEADIFAEDLETVNVNALRWSNSATDKIVPLGTE